MEEGELKRKDVPKFYVSLHAKFHLGNDETCETGETCETCESVTEPSIVLNADAVEVYESSNLDQLLKKTFHTLMTSSILEFQHRGYSFQIPHSSTSTQSVVTKDGETSSDRKIKRHAERVLISDRRYRVVDTTKYPHNAIARMEMKLYNIQKKKYMWYEGTGFLADAYMFYTCAHNVVVNLTKGPDKRVSRAQAIKLVFGQNKTVEIQLSGKDFTVPDEFEEEADINDFAYADLRKHRKDLPQEWFYTCKIPDTLGLISGQFYVCGYPETVTQWEINKVHPRRDEEGHLLYKDATSEGQSGSPLYCFDEKGHALVIAVHVGGSEVWNYAVPISRHLPTWNKSCRLELPPIKRKALSTKRNRNRRNLRRSLRLFGSRRENGRRRDP